MQILFLKGVIEPDNDIDQPMGDSTKTPTEDEIDKSGDLRSQAATAYSEQKFQEAIDLYTQAIEMNPGNALFHAKRGQAFLKLKKPNACIRDCNKALEINCDSAAAYKFRGRANRLLGNWEEAAKDLRQACKLDYDEETDEWLREVTPNAKKIEQHRLKQQRKKAERERKANELRRQKARQQQEKQQKASASAGAGPECFQCGFPDTKNLSDILSGMRDPEVMAALRDIAKNPANIEKYKSNPRIAKLIEVVEKNYPGGFCGAFPEPFPGAADGAGAGATPPPASGNADETKEAPKKPNFVDDGLD